MSGIVIRGGLALDGQRIDVRLDGDRIGQVAVSVAADDHDQELDAAGLIVAPGFVDLQVNGAAGYDLTTDPASIWAVGTALTRYGVTAFLPTIVTSPLEVVARARGVLRAGPPVGYGGATPLGLHVEGPFLNPARRGVHEAAWLRDPDPNAVADWSPDSGVRMVTLAPELPHALEMVRALVGRGVVVSAGHSAADYDEGRAGIDAGIRSATHLFNAMLPFGHRAPGLVGALLTDDRVTVGLVVDGVHLHPATVALAWRAAGPTRVSVVTDAVSALGLEAGDHQIGDAVIEVGPDGARSGGRLAGGLVGVDAAVRNLVSFTGASPAEAIGTVTSVPTALLRLGGRSAGVQPRNVADLTLLTADLHVAATIVAGRVVHTDEARRSWPVAEQSVAVGRTR